MVFLYFFLLLFLILAASSRTGAVVPELHVNQRGFADSLTQTLYEDDDEDDCTSAIGVSMAFSLIYPTLIQESYNQVQSVFGYPTDQSQLVWNEATTQLNREYQGVCPYEGCNDRKEPLLAIANSVWVDTDEGTPDPVYTKILKELLFAIDLQDEGAADQINSWVNETTRGLIDEIVAPEDLTNLILLALNSIYLKANWAKAFPVYKTNQDIFYTDATRTTVANNAAHFMHTVEYLPYSETALPGYQILKLPFIGRTLSFIIVLPDNGVDTSSLVTSVDVIDALPNLRTQRIALALPKFEIKSTYKDTLKRSLQSLGIVAPFFGGICIYENDPCDAFIEFVIQKTFISVDEDGVEAAAVTAIGVARTSAAPRAIPPIYFMADHPFQFFIYDETTELFLFEGRVVNPVPQQGSTAQLKARHSDTDFWTGNFPVDPLVSEQVLAAPQDAFSAANEGCSLMVSFLFSYLAGFFMSVFV